MTVFGDGIEADHPSPARGQTVTFTTATKKLALVTDAPRQPR
jgi:hypothetical protein